jgi:hypothetical protein
MPQPRHASARRATSDANRGCYARCDDPTMFVRCVGGDASRSIRRGGVIQPLFHAQMTALLRALADSGWTAEEARGPVRLMRRFATASEYRAAIAQARFTVAAHLAEGEMAQACAGPRSSSRRLGTGANGHKSRKWA